jgi:perosamine synthetase
LIRFPVSKPSLRGRERELVAQCVDDVQLTQGPRVEQFERDLATLLDVPHVIACANGTVALHLALAAEGIGKGDSVLVPNLTYIATANAVKYTGAEPVLVDVDPRTWNIDLAHARRLIRRNTKAIIPVHLYGNPCDMQAVNDFASAHGLRVIEDAAEGLGGSWQGRALGTLGHSGTFSFYGNKIITTGEGGAVVTRSESIARQLRLLRGQGQSPTRRFYHVALGFNYRMTELQAAIGIAQLERFNEMVASRARVCAEYAYRLDPMQARPPRVLKGGVAAPWLWTVTLPEYIDVQQTIALLADQGIESRPAFTPISKQPIYQGYGAAFPHSEYIGAHGISLPTHAEMSIEDVATICDELLFVLRIQAQAVTKKA